MANTKKRLLVTRRMPPDVTKRLKQNYDVILNPDDQILSAQDILSKAETIDGMMISLGNTFDAELIRSLPNSVKILASASVGYDHIDVETAKSCGICVTNTPDVLTDSTADIAMLLILGAARRAGEGHMTVMGDEWTGWSMEFMLGKDVTGARLGIVGMGRIGQAVAKRARGFDMELHYHNRRRLTPDLEYGAKFHDDLEALLSHADILSLHAASTPQTQKFINSQAIAKLPPGAILINTARGDLVDDEALIDALRSGHLAAAGLDVFEGEPNIHPAYRELTNVFLLPHLGSATVNTRNAMGFRALDNLEAFFNGNTPRDVVT